MTLHLIKLSVGSETVESMEEWQARLMSVNGVANPFHDTRMSPKRREEILSGGSIYWVIKRKIRARQTIIGLEQHNDDAGKSFCRIVLDPIVQRTELRTKRPFQGWRYLKTSDAPPDVGQLLQGAGGAPPDLEAALKEACAW